MSTAYVFNGFKDLNLPYAGLTFKFPVNKVTQLGDRTFTSPDERQRFHESNPNEFAMFETTRDGIEFATDLMNRHYQGYQTEGVVWVGDRLPGPKEMQRCQELGRIKKLKMIEQAAADHRVAQNAGKHHDIDTEIVDWMKEYNIHDNIYNADAGAEMSSAEMTKLATLAAMIAKNLTAPAEVKPTELIAK